MGVSYSIACTGQTQTVHYIYSRYKNVPMLYVQLHTAGRVVQGCHF